MKTATKQKPTKKKKTDKESVGAATPTVEPQKLSYTGEELKPSTTAAPKTGVQRWFWCGTLPTNPMAFTSVGDCNFLAMSANPTYQSNSRIDSPSVGGLKCLTKAQFVAVMEEMAVSMLIFSEGAVPVTVTGPDALHQTRRRGKKVKILSDEELRIRNKGSNPIAPYTRGAMDEPLADHVFMVACSNQANPQTGDGLVDGAWPPPLSETGVEWPGD